MRILDAFRSVMALETHHLVRWPEVTWQQLHNRLQWENESVRELLDLERPRRCAPDAWPWLRTRFPFSESKALMQTLTGHSGPVLGCAVSPDATFIASAGADWTVKIWDPRTGVLRATLVGHTQHDFSGVLVAPHPLGLNACAVSPDGSFIVSAGYKELKVWDVSTGKVRATLPDPTQARDCVVSPDGTFIVSANQWGTLKIWDAATGQERATLEGHRKPVSGCAVGPDGSFVVSGSNDGTLKVWDPETGEEQATLTGHGRGFARGCAVGADGSFIVAAGQEDLPARRGEAPSGGTVKIWDAATGEERATLYGHAMWACDCSVSPDGSFIVSAGQDGTLRIWDAAGGRERAILEGHGGPVRGCAVSPDGSFIVSASDDGTLKIWDVAAAKEPPPRRWHRQSVRACAVGPDGSYVVSAGDDGAVKIWDADTGEERVTLEGHGGPVNGCGVSLDGSCLVSAGGDFMAGTMRVGQSVITGASQNVLKIWDSFSGVPWRLSDLLGIDPKDVGRIYNETGAEGIRRLLVTSFLGAQIEGGRVEPDTLRDLHRRAVNRKNRLHRLTELEAPEVILANERRMLKRSLDALIVKAATGEERATLEGHRGQVNACALSPDGSCVVSASDDGTLQVWDAATGGEIRSLRGHSGPVAACAVSPDAGYVVSAGGIDRIGESFDLTLRIWDLGTFEERGTLELGSPPLACAVSPDGSFIVSGSYFGTLKIWDAATLEERFTLRGHRSRITGCAVSPDGALVVSASRDGTLRIWDAANGWSGACLPLPGDAYCVALDPRLPVLVCGDEGGNVYVADMVGIEYGPIVVTAFRRESGPVLRCPACLREQPMEDRWLGDVITCPTDGCGQRLRVNPHIGRSLMD